MSLYTSTAKLAFIESVFGKANVAKNFKNVDVWCPVCAPTNKDKRKLSIRLEDDKNHCWTCGWRSGSLALLIKKYSTREKLCEYRDKFFPNLSIGNVQEVEAQKLKLPKDFRLLALDDLTDPDHRAVLKYALNRGLTNTDLWRYKLGVSNDIRWNRRLIAPSYDINGELNYFVARAIDKDRKPKYDNPDVDKNPIIFGEQNVDWDSRIVLCEGVFDLFKCGDNAIPLLGSDLNETSLLFSKLVLNSTPVAIALDMDMFQTKTQKIAKKLISYNLDVVIVNLGAINDPGSMSKSQFQEALSKANKYSWDEEFYMRLNRASSVRLRL